MATKKKVVKKAKTANKSKKKQPGGRPFKKGQSGNPSGRPKGSKSFKTKLIEEKLAELGCDPVKVLAEICNDKKEETSLRLHAAKELANYIFPKRKSVEHSGGLNNKPSKELSESELLAIANGGEQ